MARKRKPADPPQDLPAHSADLQIGFWALLEQVRTRHLSQALSLTMSQLQVAHIDQELSQYADPKGLTLLATHGIRGETFFPVPAILTCRPELLGYYRLLYGISQKEFYKGRFGVFKCLETDNHLTDVAERALPLLCRSLCQTAGQLLIGIQPPSVRAVHELQLLTVGPQFRGSKNNAIGSEAAKEVFNLVKSLIGEPYLLTSTKFVIEVRNAAERIVQISFAPDPDITIIERLGDAETMPNTSIEINGGTDVSNVHNRLGEAEKSHLKAKAAGFSRFWTIVRARVDPAAVKQQSPTTTEFFNLDDIQDRTHQSHRKFKALLHQAIGIR